MNCLGVWIWQVPIPDDPLAGDDLATLGWPGQVPVPIHKLLSRHDPKHEAHDEEG